VRLELKRNFFSRRSFLIYLLALAPVLVMSFKFVLSVDLQAVGGTSVVFAAMYRAFFLRLVIFFASIGVFMKLFRGEVLERTLHFYFLAPVRREVLVVGKYLAGVAMNSLIFGASTVASYLILFGATGGTQLEEFVFKGPGMGHLMTYVGVTVLACIGYGAVFLFTGLAFRNPIVPAAVILGWEYINFLLPPLLKKFSVIFYLESLCPVPIPMGPFTVLAEPAPLWLAVPGLLGLSLLILLASGFLIRRMEVLYDQ
jgi:ABC-type transport system involved in multi-copper enzyme maturation permease subunit